MNRFRLLDRPLQFKSIEVPDEACQKDELRLVILDIPLGHLLDAFLRPGLKRLLTALLTDQLPKLAGHGWDAHDGAQHLVLSLVLAVGLFQPAQDLLIYLELLQ